MIQGLPLLSLSWQVKQNTPSMESFVHSVQREGEKKNKKSKEKYRHTSLYNWGHNNIIVIFTSRVLEHWRMKKVNFYREKSNNNLVLRLHYFICEKRTFSIQIFTKLTSLQLSSSRKWRSEDEMKCELKKEKGPRFLVEMSCDCSNNNGNSNNNNNRNKRGEGLLFRGGFRLLCLSERIRTRSPRQPHLFMWLLKFALFPLSLLP